MRNESEEDDEDDSLLSLITSDELDSDEPTDLEDATDSYFSDSEENDDSTLLE